MMLLIQNAELYFAFSNNIYLRGYMIDMQSTVYSQAERRLCSLVLIAASKLLNGCSSKKDEKTVIELGH